MEDFGCGAGGWTLVMKTDGTKVHSSFKFNDRLLMNLDPPIIPCHIFRTFIHDFFSSRRKPNVIRTYPNAANVFLWWVAPPQIL